VEMGCGGGGGKKKWGPKSSAPLLGGVVRVLGGGVRSALCAHHMGRKLRGIIKNERKGN